MQLIDVSYFVGEIFIAGLENTVDSTNSKILGFIKKYEAKYLKELLGDTLYLEFVAGMSVEPIEQKWTDLANKLRDPVTLESPIANYIYYWYKRNEVTDSVVIGEVKPQGENANSASSVHKTVRAWNEMVDWNYGVASYIVSNEITYRSFPWPAFIGHEFCHTFGLRARTELFRKINSINI